MGNISSGRMAYIAVLALCGIAFAISLTITDGNLVYAIDDCYIHLALARNLSETGVWGIRPTEYAFASSSPLWTCLLALSFKIFGFHEVFAAVYAVLFCMMSAWVVDRILSVWFRSDWQRAILSVCIMLALPVTTAAILGMEHAMHVFAILLLAYFYLKKFPPGSLMLATAFAAGTRYESLFVIIPLAGAELCQRRMRESFALLAGAFAPPVCYGAYALAHGGTFLPNSLMVKSALSIGYTFYDRLWQAASCGRRVENAVVYFAGLMLFALSFAAGLTGRFRLLLLASAVSVFGHLVFAKTGWTYNVNRYEMYLLALSTPLVLLAIAQIKSACVESQFRRLANLTLLIIGGIFLCGMLAYGLDSGLRALRVPRETYETPLVGARVLASLPKDRQGPVFLNDLGLIAERTTVPVIDVCGLGEQETFELLRAGNRFPSQMADVLRRRNARYAAVFPLMWSGKVMTEEFALKPVAVLYGAKQNAWPTGHLSFYAFKEEDEPFLAKHLKDFQSQLPKGLSFLIRDCDTGSSVSNSASSQNSVQ
jgi:hypothetical protein